MDDQLTPGDEPQPDQAPLDRSAVSEPAGGTDGDEIIAQGPSGSQGSAGGGEWPNPDAAASGAAPGTDEDRRVAIAERRGGAATGFKDVLDAEQDDLNEPTTDDPAAS